MIKTPYAVTPSDSRIPRAEGYRTPPYIQVDSDHHARAAGPDRSTSGQIHVPKEKPFP